jgi:hypothetical protein
MRVRQVEAMGQPAVAGPRVCDPMQAIASGCQASSAVSVWSKSWNRSLMRRICSSQPI